MQKWSVDKVYKMSDINFPFLEGFLLGAKNIERIPYHDQSKDLKCVKDKWRNSKEYDVWSKQFASNHNSSSLKLMLKSFTQRIKRGKVHHNIMAATYWIIWLKLLEPFFIEQARCASLRLRYYENSDYPFLWNSLDWYKSMVTKFLHDKESRLLNLIKYLNDVALPLAMSDKIVWSHHIERYCKDVESSQFYGLTFNQS